MPHDQYRNYWVYRIGSLAVWGIVLAVVASQGTGGKTRGDVSLVIGGWVIAYLPPDRWLGLETPEP